MDIAPIKVPEEESVVPIERTYRVLSIEDNLSNLWLLEAILARRPEIDLIAAMQGSMGLDMAYQHQPDLILLDLNLPDMHGADVLAALQRDERTASVPVIVISADATPTQIERLLRAGARSYLTKPLNVANFLRTMDEMLMLGSHAETDSGDGMLTPAPVQPRETNASALRILVVEDNPVNQQVVLHQLSRLGHDVTLVDNGLAALDVWQNREFSLVLLDCNLPGMDGYETAREIRLRERGQKHIPIIALTATATGEDRTQCLAAGMDDYLSKPVKQTELAAVLDKWSSVRPSASTIDEKQNPVLSRDRWSDLQNELPSELIEELVALFLAEVPPLVELLHDAAESGDFGEVKSIAHKLKGSCATMGVARMTALCREIEECVATQALERIVPIIEVLGAEFVVAQAVLERGELSP